MPTPPPPAPPVLPLPEPETDAQRKMLDAYKTARALFEAGRLGPQAVSIRYDRQRRPGRTLPEAALELIGSLGRFAGGTSLADPEEATAADRMSGWVQTLWCLGLVAATHGIAILPLLHVADDLAVDIIDRMRAGGPPPSLIAACVDLTVIATSRQVEPPTAEVAESMRRAMFGALGAIASTAIAALIQNLGGWDRTMSVESFYTAAVETVTGTTYTGGAS